MHRQIAGLYKRRAVVIILMIIYFWGGIVVGNTTKSKSDSETDNPSYFLSTKHQPFVKLTPAEESYLHKLGTIKVCIDANKEPYEQIKKDGENKEIVTDIMNLIAKRVGISLEFVRTRNWAESIEASRTSKCHMLCEVNQSSDQIEWLMFTKPYFIDSTVFITRQEHKSIFNPVALMHETIVVSKNSRIKKFIKDRYPNLRLVFAESDASALTMVSERKADLTMYSLIRSAYMIRKNGLFNLKIAGHFPEVTDGLSIGVAKDQPILCDILNKGLLTLTPKDVRQIVNQHVLTQVAETKSNYTLFAAVFIVVLIISIVVLFWINQFWKLNKKLKAQNSEISKLSTQLNDYIASREEVEQKLHDSESRYRLLVETANEGILVIQGNSLKYINSMMKDITSLTEKKLLSTPFLDLIHPDDKELVQNNHLKQLKNDKIGQRYSCRMFKSDGSIRWVEINGRKIEWEGAPATLNFMIDITEQKHIEQQLIESESKFKDMADLLPQIVFELDNDGKLTYINEHAYRILGYDKTEIKIGHKTHHFHIPEEKKRMEDGIQYVLDGLSPIRELEYTMVRKDGSFLKTLIYVNPIIRNNQRVGIRGIIVDINKLKEVEQGLRESEQRYRSLVETANEGILVTQHDYFKFVNSMFLKITGYSQEEILDIPFLEFVHPEDKELVKTHYTNRLNGDKVASRYQFRIYDKNHRVKWVEMNGALIEWKGEIATLNLANDITERKLTQIALIESEKNLEKAQQIALIGSWSLNIDTNAFTCTKEFCRIFNTDPLTLRGKFDSLINMIHPEDMQIFRNSMDPDYLIENPGSMEYRIIQPNGVVRTIYAEVKVDLSQAGKPIWCLGITQDITERKKAQEEKKMLQQMHNYMQYTTKAIEKERLIISRELHDNLGQALTAIKMDLELLIGRAPEEHNVIFVSKVNKITGQVIETIKTVQHITGKLRPELIDDLGLGAAIEWYVDDFALRYKIRIQLKIDSRAEVSTDISLTIFRILQESLTNIARYSEATQVCIWLYYTRRNIHFTVSDNGIGINDEQIKSKKSFGILGMTERTQSMGGKFSIACKKKGGTEIKVVIPLIFTSQNEIES